MMKEQNKMDGKSIQERVKEFIETTSAHGCGQIPTAKFKLTKFLWGLTFLSFFTFATVSSGILIAKYFTYPTKDVVSIEFGNIEFPAVTFCSLQPITITSLIDFRQNPPPPGHSVSNMIYVMQNIRNIIIDRDIGGLGQWYLKHFDRFLSNQFIFENGEENDMEQFIHDLRSFKLGCKFQGQVCNGTSFVLHKDGGFHNCFTFNGAGSDLSNVNIVRTDPASGLSLVLFMDAYAKGKSVSAYTIYNPDDPTSGQTGVRAVIHSPRTRPMPFDKGFDIPTGLSTSVALKETKRELMTQPHNNCTNDEFNQGTNYSYSVDTCYEQCQQDLLIEECGCKSSLLIPPSFDKSDLEYCGKVNITNMMLMMNQNDDITQSIAEKELENLDCEEGVMYSFGNLAILEQCACKDHCQTINYVKTISQAVWPNDNAQEAFYDTYVNRTDQTLRPNKLFKGYNTSEIINNDMIHKNFLRLNIYFESLYVETTSEVEDYPAGTLISEIGGNMGFYVGISIITLMEIFCITGAIILYCFKDWLIKCGHMNKTKVSHVNVKPVELDGDSTEKIKDKY
ncbi:unnamed protein product [Owenia fusiformis]|uniref:Uncharacterized protein n=1 Tax=Owenia fusiformis TaxID=6347 RepID=A0A8J1TQJ0_OWEFU|nr:unnamed protein product [Owenia fusiformis]